MKVSGIGVDMIEVARFRAVLRRKQDRFLRSTFSRIEQSYCRAFRDPAPHFAGTFAAKEAVQKTLNSSVPLRSIEVRREKSGKPAVWLKGRRSKSCFISITHTGRLACAIAIRI